MRSKLRNLLTIQTVKPYPKWLHSLDTVDSTNNYATKLIDDGLAHHGDVVWALEQTAGKGQRGKKWETRAGENVMMTLIVQPDKDLAMNPYHLNVLVAHTLATYLKQLYAYWRVNIKWPNDIFVNAKKAVGVLVENIYRGSNWSHAIIGIGINLNQVKFPDSLVHATSLQIESGLVFDLFETIQDIRAGILNAIIQYPKQSFQTINEKYNADLLGRSELMQFRLRDEDDIFEAIVVKVDDEGLLHLQTTNGILKCASGSLQWIL